MTRLGEPSEMRNDLLNNVESCREVASLECRVHRSVADERDGDRPVSSGRHQSEGRRLWLDAVVLRWRCGDRGVGLQSGLGLGRPPGSAAAVRTRQALGDFGRPSQYKSTP